MYGPANPARLARALIVPTTTAALEPLRISVGIAQNTGRNAIGTQMRLKNATGHYIRAGQADQAQESGCADEQWTRSMPASFTTFVGMPCVEQHCEKRNDVGHCSEQANLQI